MSPPIGRFIAVRLVGFPTGTGVRKPPHRLVRSRSSHPAAVPQDCEGSSGGPTGKERDMEASRVSAILQNMPAKERASVDENRLRILERELHDEEVVIVARCHFPFGTL